MTDLHAEHLRARIRARMPEHNPHLCGVCGDIWPQPADDPNGETLLIWQQAHFRPAGTWEKKLREWRITKLIEKEWPRKDPQ